MYIFLGIRETQIKATMRYNFIPTYCQKFESPVISSCQDVITADILLSEIDQTQMYQYFKIPLTWNIYLKYYLNMYLKYSETKRQKVEQRLPGMRERRSEELLLNKYRASAL